MIESSCKTSLQQVFGRVAEYVSMGIITLMVALSTLRLLGILS